MHQKQLLEIENEKQTTEPNKEKMGSIDIPKKHKAAVYDKPGSISTKIEELDTPEPGPGEVLINLYVVVFTDLIPIYSPPS